MGLDTPPQSMSSETLAPLISRYLTDRVRAGTLSRLSAKHIRYPLLSFSESFGSRPLNQLGPAAIDRWTLDIGRLSPATRRNYLSIVRGFCRWLIRDGKLSKDPTAHLDPIRQPRAVHRNLTESAVAALLRSLPDLRAQAIVWLMVGCGLRCVEIARLGIGDYDRQALTLRVQGKADHERVVPVPVEVAAAVNLYLNQTGSTAGPLIRHARHGHLGVSAPHLSKLTSQWMADAGVKVRPHDGISAHALRHTAATDVFRLSLDLSVVQAMLGHANIATTSRYLGPTNLEAVRAAMEGRTYRGRDDGTGQLAA